MEENRRRSDAAVEKRKAKLYSKKFCPRCHKTRVRNSFHRNPKTVTGLARLCKKCEKKEKEEGRR
jgi:transcription elongation factor Elf1